MRPATSQARSCAAPEAGISPRRAFERQMHVLRRNGNAKVEMDYLEKRMGAGGNSLAAIIGADMKHGTVAAGGKTLVEADIGQQPAVVDLAFEKARKWPVPGRRPQLGTHACRGRRSRARCRRRGWKCRARKFP